MISFIFDTSAFVSLESIYLLDLILKNFKIVTSSRVFDEISDFAVHNDKLGQAAQRVLQKKHKITIEKSYIKEKITFVSQTDNELFNIAISTDLILITDDIKLTKHTEGKIKTGFSTYFLSLFIETDLISKDEGLQKLEEMKNIRDWRENIIYISTKEELNKV